MFKYTIRSKWWIRRLLIAGCTLMILVLVSMFVFRGSRPWTCKDTSKCSIRLSVEILNHHQSKCKVTLKEPEHVEIRNNLWQTDEKDGLEMALYSAHLDPRDEYLHYPGSVRVLGVGAHPIDQKIYCHLWYKNLTKPVTVQAMVKDIGRGLEVKKKFYMEYIYTCPIHVMLILPRFVSVQFSKCGFVSSLLPLSVPANWDIRNEKVLSSKGQFTHEYGICVPVAYGQLDPYKIVEWFEFHRILGVTQFTIYNTGITGTGLRAFNHYDNMGMLRFRKMTPPVEDNGFWSKKLATLSALNRCLYENMFSYRYLVIIDLDEFIIPNNTTNYDDMIQSIKKSDEPDPPSWIFQNVYFWYDIKPDKPDPRHLRTLHFIKHVTPDKRGVSAKSFVNPRKCVAVNNHFCLWRTYDVDDYYWTRPVDSATAMVQHYKLCHLGKEECQKSMKKVYTSYRTSKFKDILTENAEDVLVELRLWAH